MSEMVRYHLDMAIDALRRRDLLRCWSCLWIARFVLILEVRRG
jgi:hypothetical protein